MKRVVVFQHVPHEILGTFHPQLKAAGFRIRYANFGRHPDLEVEVESYDGLVLLGGPMGVYEETKHPHLVREIQYVREAIRSGKTVLGICLGAQIVAAALGAKVKKNHCPEIGWHPVTLTEDGKKDPILGELAETETIFQWHGDTFAMPEGAIWLARSESCATQAFRWGENVYGLQFHLEVDEPLIERWLDAPINQALLAEAGGPALSTRIRAETPRFIARQKALSERVFSRYIERFSTKRRCLILPTGHK